MPKTQTKTNSSSSYKRVADHVQRQRRNKRLSIRKVAQIAHLPDSTIRALEQPNKSDLPKSNVAGLYRAYGEVLGVTPKRINDLIGVTEDEKPAFKLNPLPKLRSMVVLANVGTRIFVGFILLITVAYLGWQALGLVAAPNLSIDSPSQENIVTNEQAITVSGSSRLETTILINGEPAVIDAASKRFEQDIFLQTGFNRITVEAVNNFSRSSIEEFNVHYVPN